MVLNEDHQRGANSTTAILGRNRQPTNVDVSRPNLKPGRSDDQIPIDRYDRALVENRAADILFALEQDPRRRIDQTAHLFEGQQGRLPDDRSIGTGSKPDRNRHLATRSDRNGADRTLHDRGGAQR